MDGAAWHQQHVVDEFDNVTILKSVYRILIKKNQLKLVFLK